MTQRRKPNARRVARFLSELKKADWLGTARQWWPDYVFHFTDIQNAVSILKTGALFSRLEAQNRNLMDTDNASQEILGSTDNEWKDYVRLYFRPRTPTQYRNEGFRAQEQRWQGAHCPVPIYFLFDSKAILSRPDSQFTDGNLAANPEILSDAADLEQIPYRYIYHDGRFDPNERDSIVFHRHAEVIVPKQMGLDALRYIVCRSQAEYETLLHLLPANAVRRWGRRIINDNQTRLFFKQWAYVQTVELSNSQIIVHFNDFPQYTGTFRINASITDTVSDTRFAWQDASFSTDESLPLDLTDIGPLWDYSMRLTLDGHIAYAGRYQGDDLPW
jgi:hypothetical protein